MIVPTVAFEDTDKKMHVYVLANVVKFTDHGDWVFLEFSNGKTESLFDEPAGIVRHAMARMNNIYQEQMNGYEMAKQQASSLVIPTKGAALVQ